jgi:uncharacterized protein YbjT (DUF2867 family)
MSIVITTPTGNVGGRVAAALLEAGETVTLVVRNREKVAHLAAKGATVVEGSHSDPELMKAATKGARALYLASPPNMQTDNIVAFYKTFGTAAVEAVKANGIKQVVHLSSVGAEQESGTGPIAGLHENEKMLNQTVENVVHLRPAYFMENTMMQIPTILSAGQMFTMMPGDKGFPMIATQDIAARASSLLASRSVAGQQIVELMGPSDTSYNQIADTLSKLLGKPVSHQTVPGEALVANLEQMGASTHIAQIYLEMSNALINGLIHFNGKRDESSRTPTNYETFAKTILIPALSPE